MSKKKQKAPARSLVLQRRETIVSYLFLLPALFFFVGFVITPMAMGVFTSFTDASFANPKGQFVGLKNYARLFQDKIFIKSAINTVIIVVFSVGRFCDLQNEIQCPFLLPLRILSAGSYRFCGSNRCMEMDVRQIRWPAELHYPLLRRTAPSLDFRRIHGSWVYHPDSSDHLHRPADCTLCGCPGKCGCILRGGGKSRRSQ